ncbi:cbb3-type cytochrome c oxidase subunit I [Pararhizobium sp. YC-54]|uniref:cbb3-type cytochrome c oxidase subunit I n=1 Tax=Pararhizobium sp. YC-54 TaxID=2986920 RepID=UPI0021F75556|nr:cbb3-type cytochrome c oxidase subunit I [Pararhizobium sp. YC-54]MCV9997887.1 cbb3-type cytochrome c oxidase subunit I [Pararhizobium sp. YC-54]
MPRIAKLYFRTAIIFLIIGISMGLNMAISQDHSAIGAHAHANLLGWVTMAIFGGYHALNPAKAERRIAMIQYCVYTAGVALMVPALYLMLTGNPAMEPVVAIASLITFAGVLLFAVIIFSSEAATRPAVTAH